MAINSINYSIFGMASFGFNTCLNPIFHATDTVNYDVFFETIPFVRNYVYKNVLSNFLFLCHHFLDAFLYIFFQNSPDVLDRIKIWAVGRPGENAPRKPNFQVTLNIVGSVFWVIILLKNPAMTQHVICIIIQMIIENFTIQVTI